MEDFTQASLVIATNSHCPKGSVCLSIPIIVRVITIWDKVFFKLRVYFDGLVCRKKVLSESIHGIDTHIDSSVSFEFCIDEDFIGFW